MTWRVWAACSRLHGLVFIAIFTICFMVILGIVYVTIATAASVVGDYTIMRELLNLVLMPVPMRLWLLASGIFAVLFTFSKEVGDWVDANV